MNSQRPGIVSFDDAPTDGRRGGDVRVLLSPRTVGSTAGFMGAAVLGPGEKIGEHYHPHSEEFLYVVSGRVTARLDGTAYELGAREALLVPINVCHRLTNEGNENAFLVFQLCPLAPRPDLGHVDTE